MDAPRTRIRLRVSPGSRKAGIVGRYGESWKVQVNAPAESGRANDAVVRLLADTFGVPRSSVGLVSGHSARDKIVEVAGVAAVETERRLAAAGRGRAG